MLCRNRHISVGVMAMITLNKDTTRDPPIELGDYTENEDYQVHNDAEPHIRSQNIIFFSKGFRWHIKVTFKGNTITRDVDKIFIKAQENMRSGVSSYEPLSCSSSSTASPFLKTLSQRLNLGPFRLLPEHYHHYHYAARSVSFLQRMDIINSSTIYYTFKSGRIR